MVTFRRARMAVLAGALAAVLVAGLTGTSRASGDPLVDRGRYLVRIAGCNDCHTAGYASSGGATPEADWLTGDRVGWRGPWGTTYPSNLRLYMAGLSEAQWLQVARTARFRPPMPWFALRDMNAPDLRAIHRFITSLGPAGGPAPAFVPPEQQPDGPVIRFPALPG